MSTNSESGIKAVNTYIEGFNRQDIDLMAEGFNFPHVRLANGRFRTFETAEEFRRLSRGMEEQLASEGWDHTVVDSTEIIHEGDDKVHISMTVSRLNSHGEVYNRFNTLWIATNLDGHWGIQFRSSYLA